MNEQTFGSSSNFPKNNIPSTNLNCEPGLEIPTEYGQDRLVLMMQDPEHLFAYWELSNGKLEETQKQIGETGTLCLFLIGPSGFREFEMDFQKRSCYLEVDLNGNYLAQLALKNSKGSVYLLAVSSSVQTQIPQSADSKVVFAELQEGQTLTPIREGSSSLLQQDSYLKHLEQFVGSSNLVTLRDPPF